MDVHFLALRCLQPGHSRLNYVAPKTFILWGKLLNCVVYIRALLFESVLDNTPSAVALYQWLYSPTVTDQKRNLNIHIRQL